MTWGKLSLIQCSLLSDLSLRAFLLSCLALTLSSSSASAEIYTYEKNGVIVISSEPPPHPSRRTAKVKKRRRNRGSSKYSKNKKDRKRGDRRLKVNKRSPKPKQKNDALKLPRELRKQKTRLDELSEKYHLPSRLIPSVTLSCLALSRTLKGASRLKDKSEKYTCLSPQTQEMIREYVDQMGRKGIENSEEDSKRRVASPLKHKVTLSDSLEYSAWLIRKLINRFHGDLTLAISSYYEAAKEPTHSVYTYKTQKRETLHFWLNKSSRPLKTQHVLKQPKKRVIEFTRLVLSFWRGQ